MRIALSDYNPDWPKMFKQEVSIIMQGFPLQDTVVEHVGSTSVAGIKAKPVIDIMVGVPSLPEDLTGVIDHLKIFGYQYMERYNLVIPERRFFQKDQNEIRTHQIHLTSFYSDFWDKLLFFRNLLREDAETRQLYEELKLHLAERSWNSVNDYASAKNEFIEDIDRRRKALKVNKQSKFPQH